MKSVCLSGEEMEKKEKPGRNDKKTKGTRQSRKYGQVKLKHSKKGCISCLIAGGSIVSLLLLIFIAYIKAGNAAAYLGVFGILLLLLSWVGIMFAIKGRREREKNYITCKIGLVCNILFFIILLGIFIRGIVG